MTDDRILIFIVGDEWSIELHNTETHKCWRNIINLRPVLEEGSFFRAKIKELGVELNIDNLRAEAVVHNAHTLVPFKHIAFNVGVVDNDGITHIIWECETRVSYDDFLNPEKGEKE